MEEQEVSKQAAQEDALFMKHNTQESYDVDVDGHNSDHDNSTLSGEIEITKVITKSKLPPTGSLSTNNSDEDYNEELEMKQNISKTLPKAKNTKTLEHYFNQDKGPKHTPNKQLPSNARQITPSDTKKLPTQTESEEENSNKIMSGSEAKHQPLNTTPQNHSTKQKKVKRNQVITPNIQDTENCDNDLDKKPAAKPDTNLTNAVLPTNESGKTHMETPDNEWHPAPTKKTKKDKQKTPHPSLKNKAVDLQLENARTYVWRYDVVIKTKASQNPPTEVKDKFLSIFKHLQEADPSLILIPYKTCNYSERTISKPQSMPEKMTLIKKYLDRIMLREKGGDVFVKALFAHNEPFPDIRENSLYDLQQAGHKIFKRQLPVERMDSVGHFLFSVRTQELEDFKNVFWEKF